MKTTTSLTAAVGGTVLLLLAAPAGATTSVSGAVNVTANAGIGAVSATDTHNASFTGAPTALSTSATATAVSGADSSTTAGAVAATWASANSGAVDFTNYGWNLNSSAASLPSSGSMWGSPDWSYTFTATSSGTFTMNYAVTSTGNGFGLWGWNIGWSGLGGGQILPGSAAYTPDTTGLFTRVVTAGQTYTIDLATNANISVAPGASYAGNMNGVYNWSIGGASVPEPAAWAFMFVGLFGAGASLRRRRALHAAL